MIEALFIYYICDILYKLNKNIFLNIYYPECFFNIGIKWLFKNVCFQKKKKKI